MKQEKAQAGCEVWESRLVAYADGESSAADAVQVEAHFAGCATCQAFFAEVRQLYAAADAGETAATGNVSAAVMEIAEREALHRELQILREEMTAMRREMIFLRREVARRQEKSRPIGVQLMPYAAPEETTLLSGRRNN